MVLLERKTLWLAPALPRMSDFFTQINQEMMVMEDSVVVDTPRIEGPDFDPDAVRAKYAFERDKRGRTGIGQYIETKGDFSRYIDDPYVEPGFTRDPIVEHLHAFPGSDGLHPDGKVCNRARDLRACAAHRAPLRHVPIRALPDPGQGDAMERGRRPLDRHHGSQGRDQGPLRHHRQRPLEPSQAAWNSRHPELQGPYVPHQPLGLRIHRR